MNPMILLGLGLLAIVMVSGSMVLMMQLRQHERFVARVRVIHGHKIVRAPAGKQQLRTAALSAIATIGQTIVQRGLLPSKTVNELQALLRSAGLSGTNGLGLFVGAKIMLAAGLPLAVFLLVPTTHLPPLMAHVLPAGAAMLGLVAPDYVIGSQRKSYLKKLEDGLPDALDVMVICTQAGIGLAPAIVEVSTELVYSHPAVAKEFAVTASELGMIADSRVALTNLGARTGLDSYKRLATALNQSQVFGTPVTAALRLLSQEMRQEMLTRFEARAARLGVILTLPTMFFIMPCVFMIAGGPAVLQVMHSMGSM